MTGEAPVVFVRRYSTLSEEASRQLFPDIFQLHAEWGVLFVEDRDSQRWTLLGDHQFCATLEGAGKQSASAPEGVEQLASWGGKHLPESVLEEFPFEAFEPAWLLRGCSPERWPEEGPHPSPPLDVQVPRLREGACVGHLMTAAQFHAMCQRALDAGRAAPPEEYMRDHGRHDHIIIVGKTVADRALAMAFSCEGLELAKQAQTADGRSGPIVSAREIAPPDPRRELWEGEGPDDTLGIDRGVIIDARAADLQGAPPAFVREEWFQGAVRARIRNRFPLARRWP